MPQIEIDQENGDVYILVTGTTVERPTFHNREYTGVYRLKRGASVETPWEHLRGTVMQPPDTARQYELSWYPTSFAIDLGPGGGKEIDAAVAMKTFVLSGEGAGDEVRRELVCPDGSGAR